MPTFDPSEVTPSKESVTFDPSEVTPVAEPKKSWMQKLSSYLPDSYGQAQADIQESERKGAETVGKQLVEYSPITGVPEVASGVKNLVSPAKGTNRRQATRKILSGVGKTMAPLAVPALVAAPVATLAGLAGGMAMQTGTTEGLKALGVSKDTAELVGDAVGFVPPGAAARRIFKGFRGGPEVPPPVDPLPPPPPIEGPLGPPAAMSDEALRALASVESQPGKAGLLKARGAARDIDLPEPPPIEPPVKSARESAQVFDPVQNPPMKSAKESASVFMADKRLAKPVSPPRPKGERPVVPETGIPENVARGTDARENLAQEIFGQPFDSLPNSSRIGIDDLIAEGLGTSSAKVPPEAPPLQKLPGERRRRNSERGSVPVTREEAEAALAAAKKGIVKAAGVAAGDEIDVLPAPPPVNPVPLPKTSKPVLDFVADESGTFKLPTKQQVRKATVKKRTQLTDEFAPVHDLVADAKLSPDSDPYIAARMYAGHAGKIDNRLKELRGILKPARKEKLMDAMRDYAVYERHEELAGRIPGYKLPNGQTLADIQGEKAALEAVLGPQKLARVKQYGDQLRAYSNARMKEALDAGLINQEAYNAMQMGNQKYIPLQRLEYVANKLDEMPHSSSAFSLAEQNVYKRIHGSDKEILDPLQAMIRNTYKVVSLVERNKVARKMANLSNDPQFSGIIKPLQPNSAPAHGNSKFSALVDGKKFEYEAPTDVVESLKGLNRNELDIVTKMAGMSSRALRAGATTLSLPFIPANMVRDAFTANLVSKVGFYPADWVKGFAAAVRRGKEFNDFMESGGSFSGYFERNQSLPSSVKELSQSTGMKVLKTIVNPKQLMEHIGTTIELAPRIGVHMRSKAKGLSDIEAGYNARNSTVDFAKSGTAMKVYNQWVPFLNARLQGTLNSLATVKQRPGHAALNISSVIGAPVIATYAFNHKYFPDVMKDIAPYEKENNFILVYGREKDEKGNYTQVAKIPKGDVGRIFGNPLENFLNYAYGDDARSLGELAMQIGSDVSPISFEKDGKFSPSAIASGATPPTAKAMLEGFTNKNFFTDRPIVPPGMEEASPAKQFDKDTPGWVKKVGQYTGTSPLKIENAIGTQFGALGRQVLKPSSLLPSVASRFAGARGGEQEQKGWEALKESKQVAADTRLDKERAAQALYDELKALPPADRNALVQKRYAEGTIKDETLEKLADIIQKDTTPSFERSLKSASADARAVYMVDQLKKVPVAERQALFEKWSEQNLITDKVVEAIEARLAAQ